MPKCYKCPSCNRKLKRGRDQRYEDIVEHCCDPNKYQYQKPPKRLAFYCRTWGCKKRGKAFFDYHGDEYMLIHWWQRLWWEIKHRLNNNSIWRKLTKKKY